MAASSLWHAANSTLRSCAAVSTELPDKVKKLPNLYAEYIAQNSQSVGQIESTLRSLTYLLPGARLNDSELASESLHTFVQLLSIYHDHLLKKKARESLQSHATLPITQATKTKPTHHARYTTFWSDSSTMYTKLATLLKVVQYTELLCEMTARGRGGEQGRWRVIVMLESVKAVLRLALLRITNSRPVLTPPLPLREDITAAAASSEESEESRSDELQLLDPIPYEPQDPFGDSGIPTPPMSDSDKLPFQPAGNGSFAMPRTGFNMPLMPSPDTISSYLLEHVITPDDIKPVKQLVHRLTSISGQAAEVMYILRPLIYALLMQRLARRFGYEGQKWKQYWTPWLVGLAIEYIARQITKRDLCSHLAGTRNSSSALEQDELTKRGWNLAWWGMRGAFYQNVTRGAIHSVVDKLKGKPVLDLVGGVFEDYEHLWGNYYFSTSTM